MVTTYWWEPDNPTRKLPGTLVEGDERGWTLELDGYFNEAGAFSTLQPGQSTTLSRRQSEKLDIVLGTTSQNKPISLMDCAILNIGVPVLGARGSLRLWPRVIVYGVHFESADDFRLTSLSLRYSNLDTWVATSGFEVTVNPEPYCVRMVYTKPANVKSVLSEGLSASINFAVRGPSLPASSEISITQQSWLTIKSDSSLTFDQILRNVRNFEDFVSLGVGETLLPREMSGTCNALDLSGTNVSAEIDLIHNRKPLISDVSEVAPWEMLFTLNDVRDHFGEFIRAWFSRGVALQSLYDLYFGTIRGSSMYVEHRFLNLFQAIESYDRRTEALPSPEELQEQEERMARMLAPFTGSDKQWLKKRLKRIDGPAAAERIKRVVASLNADWLLTPEDIALAADLRNYHTHFDPSLESRLPTIDVRYRIMHNLAVRLRVLCELILLTAVGFAADDLRSRVDRSRRVQRHLVNQSSIA